MTSLILYIIYKDMKHRIYIHNIENLQKDDKDINDVTITNVLFLGIETPENNCNIWKNNDD